jgi:hypothetical protein
MLDTYRHMVTGILVIFISGMLIRIRSDPDLLLDPNSIPLKMLNALQKFFLVKTFLIHKLISNVRNPDPDLFVGSGSGNFDRIRILVRIRPPEGAFTNQKR